MINKNLITCLIIFFAAIFIFFYYFNPISDGFYSSFSESATVEPILDSESTSQTSALYNTFSEFSDSESQNSTPKTSDSSPPIILEWSHYWDELPTKNLSCQNQCIFTKDKSLEKNATLITFYYPWMNVSNLPKSSPENRMNVFVSFESPVNAVYPEKLPETFFNATFSYMFSSDYPILYDCFKKLEEGGGGDDDDRWSEKEVENAISKKSKTMVTFVSNCQTSSKRELLIQQIEYHLSIKKYGFCYNHKKSENCKRGDKCEFEAQQKHFFVLALENSHCIDYFSEKVWKLRNLIVPIILDRSLLKNELAYLNEYVIALSDFKSVKDMANYLKFLMINKQEYKKYFGWTKLYKKSQSCGLLRDLPCKLCNLATKVKNGYRSEKNVKKWWMDKNTCQPDYVKNWLKNHKS